MLGRYPQGDDPEATWSLQVIGNWMKLVHGIGCTVLSVLILINLFFNLIYQETLPLLMDVINVVPIRNDEHDYGVAMAQVLLLLLLCQHILFSTMTGQRVVQDVVPLLSVRACPLR